MGDAYAAGLSLLLMPNFLYVWLLLLLLLPG
jgi:hypothetical protein